MKSLLSIFFIFTHILFGTIDVIKTQENNDHVLITKDSKDMTGDGLQELIELKGVLLAKDSQYYKSIWIDITSPLANQWKISLEGGYEPKLYYVDLTHDHMNELFYQSSSKENGEPHISHIYTFKNGAISKIPLPEKRHIQAEFTDNFKVEIQFSPSDKPIVIDIAKKKDTYIKQGIYDNDGSLLQKKSAIIQPTIFSSPTLISKSKGYGLKSYNKISLTSNTDQVGIVEILWYYTENQWIVLKTKWISNT